MGLFDRSRKAKKPEQVPDQSSYGHEHEKWRQTRSSLSWRQPASPPWASSVEQYQVQAPFQCPGRPDPSSPPPPYQSSAWPRQPIIVHQHYYLSPPPMPEPRRSGEMKSKHGSAHLSEAFRDGTTVAPILDNVLPRPQCYRTRLLSDQITGRLDDVVTRIDRDRLCGNEKHLFSCRRGPPSSQGTQASHFAIQARPKMARKKHAKGQVTAAASDMAGNYFAKVELYANSRLPPDLPPLRLYMSAWPLLCLAAQYSDRVYERPRGAERDTFVDADFCTGAKAMVIKSVPMDHANVIVLAIRGTASFMDWAVNLDMAPASPEGFMDDPDNLCHSGFLSVARKMVRPVARRLSQLLHERPARSKGSYSLLVTGHSAGGAVAALLYAHLTSLSAATRSDLADLVVRRFKRVHCVTFGAPPVSLLPLGRWGGERSLFLGFVNEGDPVARADREYVRSLVDLLAAPAPVSNHASRRPSGARKGRSASLSSDSVSARSSISSVSWSLCRPVWPVPPAALSNAGRIVVLRSGDTTTPLRNVKRTVKDRLNEGTVAQMVTNDQLGQAVWGDPVAHVMKLYYGRIETLAVAAVTAKGY